MNKSRNILDRFRLDGKKAIVTGGGQGLGRAFALALAEAGADVAIAGRHSNTLDDVAGEIKSRGRKTLTIPTDITILSDINHMVETVISEWKRLDIAVNNVGTAKVINALDIDEGSWDSILATNLRGTFFCCQSEARAMVPKRYGKIINIASVLGHIVNKTEYHVPYYVSKAGILHLTRCLAAEWARFGIRVNSITPGYIRTAALEMEGYSQLLPIWIEQTPLGRLGNVEDLQGAVVFLASELSDFMTGNDMIIDGGFLTVK